MLYIIIIAVIVFLFICGYIFKDEILNLVKSKFKKKSKKKNNEPKPEAKTLTKEELKYEDFVPLSESKQVDETRDTSLDDLFGDDDLLFDDDEIIGFDPIPGEEENIFTNEPSLPKQATNTDPFDFFNSKNFSYRQKEKSISQKFQELPPEMKALILDGTLKRREDDVKLDSEILNELANNNSNKKKNNNNNL